MLFFFPVSKLGKALIIVQNPWINGVCCFALSVWPFYTIGTVLGGICLVVSGLLLLAAGLNVWI